jgi:hypothetical protein
VGKFEEIPNSSFPAASFNARYIGLMSPSQQNV